MLNCWLESYNFQWNSSIYNWSIVYNSQIHSFYWVICVEDFRRRRREFQTEKHKDQHHQLKSSKQVLLKESVM